jgi:pseudaminic acid cytidylyltransferase
MRIAVIPARGGSKRIPRKNIKDFCGKPMIAWSIEAATASGLFDHIIVSTDDIEISEIAKQWGAEVPFVRPQELSDDHTATRPVVNHAIGMTEKLYGCPEYVCCIYATAPFIQAEDIKLGLAKLIEAKCEFAFTVTSFPYPIQRAIKITTEGRVDMFNPEYCVTRSQDLEDAYHDAGQFYWGRTDAFTKNLLTYSEHAVPIILPRHRVQDIDTPEDWYRAELMFKAAKIAEA